MTNIKELPGPSLIACLIGLLKIKTTFSPIHAYAWNVSKRG